MTSPINNTADSINSAIAAVGAGATVAPKNDPVVPRVSQSYETVTEQPGSSIKLSPEEQAVVTKLDSGLKALGAVRLGISLDENSKKPVIKIFDKKTGEEVLQIPAKHSLHIANTVELVRGLIFDKKV